MEVDQDLDTAGFEASVAAKLQEMSFFKQHSQQQIALIVTNMQRIELKAGAVVFKKGTMEDGFYMIPKPCQPSRFVISEDPSANVPGSFGETCLRYPHEWRFSLRANEDAVLLKITPDVYRRMIVKQAKQEESKYLGFLRRVPLLKELTEEQLLALSKALGRAEFKDGERIITQGTLGSEFYFIESGAVKCLQRTQKGPTEISTEVNRYSAGDYFGEGALLMDAPRNADVIAIGDVVCLTLRREDFNDLLGSVQLLMEHNFKARVLMGVSILSKLTDSERSELADMLTEEVYENGQQIISQGDVGDKFYIIKEGEVRFTRTPKEDETSTRMCETDSIASERATAAAAAAAAAAASAAMAAAAANIESAMPPPFPGARSVAPPPIPSTSENPQTSSTAQNILLKKEPERQQEEQQNGREEEIGRLFSGAYFGEGTLLTDSPRRASAYAVGQVTLLSLERSQFNLVFDESLQDILNRDFEKRRKEDTDTVVEFTDLEQLAVLGAGSYGQVLLVTNKVTGRTYALKSMSKQRIVEMGQQRHILNEKLILETASHPFIVSLRQSYVSPDHVFVLMEAVLGGELFAYMRCAARLRLKDAMFYMAQVILVFEYLHSHNIIYRDLKPENLLVAANGYLKFTDFGLAKVLANDRKTYTLCGTPAYASPEVYSLAGHGKAADWWTLGVLTHELLSATTPFDGDAQQIFKSLEEYSRAYPNIRLPKGLSGDSADLTLRLLNPNPNKRLGSLPRGGGARDVRMHPLFRNFSFAKLIKMEVKPPFEPKIKSTFDTNNFYKPSLKGKPIQLENVDPSTIRIGNWSFD